MVRGLVELYVPQDRHIEGIRVKLRAVQSVAILPDQRDMITFAGATPIAWEDTVLMEKVVEIGLPASKSHATVPGDDTISSSTRRGRSRATQASRGATPSTSRPATPRRSQEDAPPVYEENESASASPQLGSHSSLGAVMRAISRGRPISRSQSRAGSRGPSRTTSRNTSPTRGSVDVHSHSNSGHTTIQGSPSLSSSTSLQRNDSGQEHVAENADAEFSSLTVHLSRTGLSMGRSEAFGSHPHTNDRIDHFGVGPTTPLEDARGRHEAASSSANETIPARSVTLSPSRGLSRRHREESRSRLAGLGRKNIRAPSVDTGSGRFNADHAEPSGLNLNKGIHGFEFAFILPSDSPPYERSPFGRVRYVVKATAFGAGRAKSNIEAWRDMFPVVNPSSDGGPMPLTVLYNDIHSTVGLLSIACTSNNISVGGIFNVDIFSPTPPPDLIVYLVRVSVETTTELRTRKKGKQYVPTQRHKLFEKGWVPPRPNDPHGHGDGKPSEGIIRDPTRPGSRPDDAWTVQGIARMPNDNIVRSTTSQGTKASIRFSHQLLVEVVHSREPEDPSQERKLKVFALRQAITLPSCCVAYDAVTLPPYSLNDDNERSAVMPYDVGQHGGSISHASHHAVHGDSSHDASSSAHERRRIDTAARVHGPDHEFCVCGQSFADLSERERRLIPVRPMAELPLDGLSHHKIGELPDSLRRSTSRSSSTSRESRVGRVSSSVRRSISLRRSVSRARSPSVGSTSSRRRGRAPSLSRVNNEMRLAGRELPGRGERGQGTISNGHRGSLHDTTSIDSSAMGDPPTYSNVVEEENEENCEETYDHQHPSQQE